MWDSQKLVFSANRFSEIQKYFEIGSFYWKWNKKIDKRYDDRYDEKTQFYEIHCILEGNEILRSPKLDEFGRYLYYVPRVRGK